jgi:hypothetical protein
MTWLVTHATLLGLLTATMAGTAQAQLDIFPARQRLDSLVVSRPEVELRFVFPAFDSPAGWSVPVTDLVRKSAEARVGGALRAAEEAGPPVPGQGPAFVEEGRTWLVWGSPELVVLRDHVYSYTAGAAHGEDGTQFRILAWHKGELKPASLSDLLDWNRELLSELNRQLEGQLRLQGASVVLEGGWKELDKRRLQRAAPTAHGLLYVFDPYEVGSHAEGFYEVLVPWRVLAMWIPKDGRLDRMLRARP